METCALCSLKDTGDERSLIFYDDMRYAAMLVTHPEAVGHFVVFPWQHEKLISHIYNRSQLFDVAIELAEQTQRPLAFAGYSLRLDNYLIQQSQRDGSPVYAAHTHIHVVPQYEIKKSFVLMSEVHLDELAAISKALRAGLQFY